MITQTSPFAIIRRFQITPPTDVFGILDALGMFWSVQDLERGVSVILRRSEARSEVVLSTDLNEAQKRFSAAHALAHELMHADLLSFGDHVDRLFPRRPHDGSLSAHHEEQANRVAIDILLPLPVIAPLLSGEDDQHIRLAETFGVPEKAMRARLKEFNTDLGDLILGG